MKQLITFVSAWLLFSGCKESEPPPIPGASSRVGTALTTLADNPKTHTDSLQRLDSLLRFFTQEMLDRGWIKKGDYLRLDSFDKTGNTYKVLQLRQKAGKERLMHTYWYLVDQEAVVDMSEKRKEITFDAHYNAEKDKEKMREFNRFLDSNLKESAKQKKN